MKTRIIIALNVVLVALVAAIAVQCIFFDRDVTSAYSSDDKAFPAPLERDATLHAGDSVDYSNVFGSTGNESIVDAFTANEGIFVFGRTDGNDADCTSLESDSFMVKMSSELKIIGIYPVESGLVAASYGEGGFLCLSRLGDETTLTVYDYNGARTRSRKAYAVGAVADPSVFLTHDGYTLIHTVSSAATDKPRLLVTQYDFYLNVRRELTIASTRALSLISHFELGDRSVLFCTAENDLGKCVAVAEIKDGQVSPLTLIDESAYYTCFSVMPRTGGWALLCSFDNKSGVILLSSDFYDIGFVELGGSAESGNSEFVGDRFYLELGGELYACDASFSRIRRLPGLSGRLLSSVTTKSDGLYLLSSEQGLVVVGTDGTGRLTLSGSLSGGHLLKLGDRYYVVSKSSALGGEVTLFFGGTDIYAARLSI